MGRLRLPSEMETGPRWAALTNRSPATRNTIASKAPHTRPACSTIVSSTGWMSVGELEIARKISAVAICRSNASFVSLNSRTFSIAITAWSAKVWRRLICCRENRPVASGHGDGAHGLALSEHRHRDQTPVAESPCYPSGARRRISVTLKVANMDQDTIDDGSRPNSGPGGGHGGRFSHRAI